MITDLEKLKGAAREFHEAKKQLADAQTKFGRAVDAWDRLADTVNPSALSEYYALLKREVKEDDEA